MCAPIGIRPINGFGEEGPVIGLNLDPRRFFLLVGLYAQGPVAVVIEGRPVEELSIRNDDRCFQIQPEGAYSGRIRTAIPI